MKNKIDNNANQKFNRRDHKCSDESAQNKGARFKPEIDEIKRCENCAPGKEHRPVSVPPKKHFNEAIHDTANAKHNG